MAGLDTLWLVALLATGKGTWRDAAARSLLGWASGAAGTALLVAALSSYFASDVAFPFRTPVQVGGLDGIDSARVDLVLPILNRSDKPVTIHPPLNGSVRAPGGPLAIPPHSQGYLLCQVSVGANLGAFCYEYRLGVASNHRLTWRRGYVYGVVGQPGPSQDRPSGTACLEFLPDEKG